MKNQQNTNEITKEVLIELRSRLPHGYANTLVKIIKREHKKVYTAQHIRRTLCIAPKKPGNKIIEEAFKLASKTVREKRIIHSKISLNDWK